MIKCVPIIVNTYFFIYCLLIYLFIYRDWIVAVSRKRKLKTILSPGIHNM